MLPHSRKHGREPQWGSLPAGNFFLCDGIVADTGDTGLCAAGAARQLLIASIFPEAASITSTDITKIAALIRLSAS